MTTRTFSIVIPTYNRPRQLVSCLESLTRLDYPAGDFEVIVVDDGSPTPLDPHVNRFKAQLALTLVRQPNGGPAAARNTGSRRAQGRYLAFTDDDCQPRSDWLRQLQVILERFPDRMVGGRVVNRLDGNPYSIASQAIKEVVYAHYNEDPHDARFFATDNLAVPARLFQRIGGFDLTFGRPASEDRELCDRWLHLGHRMVYAPEAVVLHAHDLSFRTFVKQHFSYGRGALQYHRVRQQRGSGDTNEAVSMHARLPNLLRPVLADLPPPQVRSTSLLMFVWQAANTAGFFYEAFRQRRRSPAPAEALVPAPVQVLPNVTECYRRIVATCID